MENFLQTSNIYPESHLVALLKSRDNKAFSYLYDHYSPALLGIITQIVRDEQLSNDVLQEVFINIWKKIESYDASKGRLFTWMLNIARNASIDTVRSSGYRQMQKNQSLNDPEEPGIDGQDNVNVDLIGLRKFVEKLKKEHRVLLELAYFKGHTHEEIAKMEGIPLGTVKTRIRSALLQLRQEWK
ncbi:MAG TPA: sigma-70 family RNA polymerase sigma factor [Flavitalea sp.]|nr:sigma-70 family RNA polymerase sigma factor [Flavitalea sp.]